MIEATDRCCSAQSVTQSASHNSCRTDQTYVGWIKAQGRVPPCEPLQRFFKGPEPFEDGCRETWTCSADPSSPNHL